MYDLYFARETTTACSARECDLIILSDARRLFRSYVPLPGERGQKLIKCKEKWKSEVFQAQKWDGKQLRYYEAVESHRWLVYSGS